MSLLLKPEHQTVYALKDVSFKIETGSFVGLIGANGAGKTTILKILSGLIPPSTGSAKVLGHLPFKRSLNFRKQISLVMGQKAQLWWDLPGLDAFDLLRAIYEIPRPIFKERIHMLSELLNVQKLLNTQIRRLSLGERMKMELIGAIIHWPKVLFLDEPTIGLDIVAAEKLREFLLTHNKKEKTTIILTSHNMDDIEKLCSRVLILQTGQLIYDGSPEGLTEKEDRQIRVLFRKEIEKQDLASLTGIPLTHIRDTETAPKRSYILSLPQEKFIPALQALIAKLEIMDLGFEEVGLENVIQKLFDRRETLSP